MRDNHRRVMNVTLGETLRASILRYTDENRVRDFLVAHPRERYDREMREHECVPISGAFFRHQQDRYSFEARIEFFDFRHGIGNEAIFELPDSCRNL